MIRREEMLTRSGSLGEQLFSAPGLDAALLRAAGFAEVRAEDRTANMAVVSAARRQARAAHRAAHRAELEQLEGAEARAGYDEYLRIVELLATERRLTRTAYVAHKPLPAR